MCPIKTDQAILSCSYPDHPVFFNC
jgi:hypothetical protein